MMTDLTARIAALQPEFEAVREYAKNCKVHDEILSETYAASLTTSAVPRVYADAAITELLEALTALRAGWTEILDSAWNTAHERAETAEAVIESLSAEKAREKQRRIQAEAALKAKTEEFEECKRRREQDAVRRRNARRGV